MPSLSQIQILNGIRDTQGYWRTLLHGRSSHSEKVIKRIQEIMSNGTENIGTDQFKISPIGGKLYTTGLVYCSAVLFLGDESAAMMHLMEKDENLKISKHLIEQVNPNKIVTLMSFISDRDSTSEPAFASKKLFDGMCDLMSYIKLEKPNCDFKNFDYPNRFFDSYGLFFDGSDRTVILATSRQIRDAMTLMSEADSQRSR